MVESSFTFRLYKEQWTIAREDFVVWDLYFYAVHWARNIIAGCRRNEEDEVADEVETELVEGVDFVFQASAKIVHAGEAQCVRFHAPCGFPNTFKRNARIVLSETDPDVDGRWSKVMIIDHRKGMYLHIEAPCHCLAILKIILGA